MHITLSGYYGFDNAGDEALLSAITSSIGRLAPEADFTVFSGLPHRTQELHDISAVYYLNLWKIIKTLRSTDLLISGGGSIFQDITSGRSLPYYIGIVALARFFDKPVIFYAQGVGPIKRGLSRFLMRLIGNHATIITLRDKDSMDYLHSIGVNQPPMKVTADPVFTLQPTEKNIVEMKQYFLQVNLEGRPSIGVSLREWQTLNDYAGTFAALLDMYYDKGYSVIFIPMEYPDDITAGEKVAALMQRPSVVLQDHLTSTQLLAFVGELKLLIGMRLHSLIFAANRGVPMVGVSYDPKVDSFLEMFGQESLPVDENAMQKQIDHILGQDESEFRNQALVLQQQANENVCLALSLLKKNEPEEAQQPEDNDESLMSAESSRSTGRNFIWVAITIFFAKVLGLLREVLFGRMFGTTAVADAFQTIFGVPQLLFTAIGNALSAINIPYLTGLMKGEHSKERKEYVDNFMAQITLIFGVLSILGVVLSPLIVRIWGFEGQARDVVLILCMIMMPCLLFVNLAYFCAGILQTHRYFLLSSLIAIPFNVLIILAIIFRGDNIIFIGAITTAGWFLQFFIQYPQLRRLGYRLWGKISFKSPESRNLYRNLVPVILGYAVLQISLLVDRGFGTFLPEGTASALGYGSNLFLTTSGIFIMAMSIVIFPRLAKYCQQKDFTKIIELLGTIWQTMLFVLLPYMLIIIFFHRDIISIIFERGGGEFNYESTTLTATAFLFYSFAAVGYACQEIFNRVFYAFKRYRVPAIASVVCIVLNVLLTFMVYRTYGIAGISITTAFCMLLYAGILLFFLRKKLGAGMGLSVIFGLVRCMPPLLAMLLVFFVARRVYGDSMLIALATMAAGGAVYLAVAFAMGFGKILKR